MKYEKGSNYKKYFVGSKMSTNKVLDSMFYMDYFFTYRLVLYFVHTLHKSSIIIGNVARHHTIFLCRRTSLRWNYSQEKLLALGLP